MTAKRRQQRFKETRELTPGELALVRHSPALVFRQHVRTDEPNPFDLTAPGHQLEKAEWEQPAIDFFDAGL